MRPVAWAVNHSHGTTVWDSETKARRVADEWLASRVWVWAEVVPLYRSPSLTDAEREALHWFAHYGLPEHHAATLRGLLTRMSGDEDCPAPDNAAKQDNAPPVDATPSKCTVPPEWTSRPYWVDPPSGHRYGFPRLYDPSKDGDMTAWMIRHGYPERLARQGLACTFTACTEDGEK